MAAPSEIERVHVEWAFTHARHRLEKGTGKLHKPYILFSVYRWLSIFRSKVVYKRWLPLVNMP